MKARAKELREEARGGARGAKKIAADLEAVLKIIDAMSSPDRELAERVHAIVTETAPSLSAKLWYGQPAWSREGKVVCFFRSGVGDKERYSTFGFSAQAQLDDGGMWPTSYALIDIDASVEADIAGLVKKAAGL